jgi:hypothetical protein
MKDDGVRWVPKAMCYGTEAEARMHLGKMAMVEVVLGYVALGGLLAILADKLARRAG